MDVKTDEEKYFTQRLYNRNKKRRWDGLYQSFFIVALGVAFYSGIRASEPSMRITADQYFDDSELMDLKVMGTMGLTKADIKSIGKVSGIEAVEGGYSKDVLCPVGDNEKVVHMLSMQKNFNQVSVVKGRRRKKPENVWWMKIF